jgi:predicted ester cyclase
LIHYFISTFPDLQITVDEIISVSGRAGVRAHITGTHQGEFLGISPTGKSVTVALHEFHHLQDGLITHTWHLEDWFGMLHYCRRMASFYTDSSEVGLTHTPRILGAPGT